VGQTKARVATSKGKGNNRSRSPSGDDKQRGERG
jgi:hypothetical protein